MAEQAQGGRAGQPHDGDGDRDDEVRSANLAKLARGMEMAAGLIRACYPLVAHTSDLLVQVGKFAPSKDKGKGKCPAPILRITTTCRGAGSALTSIALCLKGAMGVCTVIASGIRCVNHRSGVGAGLDRASEPERIVIKTMAQLDQVLSRWRSTGVPILLDVGPEATIAFAHHVFRHLRRQGEAELALIRDGDNMKIKVAQHARLTGLLHAHPLPSGVLEALEADEVQGEAALHQWQPQAAAGNAQVPPPAPSQGP